MLLIQNVACKAALAIAVVTCLSITPSMAQETLRYAFRGGKDGSTPTAGLISDKSGNLYGTTEFGCGTCDCGTIFEFTSSGKERLLHAYQGDDGAYPLGELVLDASGNLYGTTQGNDGESCKDDKCGTVFKLAPNGIETQLYAFQGGTDGLIPQGNIVIDAYGNLYGTTTYGGKTAQCNGQGCGTIFMVTAAGTKTTLYTFCSQNNYTDGAYPSDLIMDASGNLYGATLEGGTNNWGEIFKIAADGTESVLYSFQHDDDGAFPHGSLLLDVSGNIYGATEAGGSNGGFGTVFRLAPDGTLTPLYAFGEGPDGGEPNGGLVMDGKGDIYGTAFYGGTGKCKASRSGCGVVFEVTPAGKEKVVYSFNKSDGYFPMAGLLSGKYDVLYGTTSQGGVHSARCNEDMDRGCGVVFEVQK